MNKKIKKIITLTALAGGAMYAFNKFIDYTASYRGLTLDENENYSQKFLEILINKSLNSKIQNN